MVLYILIYSSVITLLLTAAQLYRDYRRDVDDIHQQIEQIRIGILPTIRNNLWVVNYREVQVQLNNLTSLPDVQFLQILDEQDQPLLSAGEDQQEHIITTRFPIQYQHRGKIIELGALRIVATLEGVYQRLVDQALVILVSQATKTFLVSAFIFILFQWLITRHLGTIALWARNLDVSGIDQPLTLNRKLHEPDQRDELDAVMHAFNQMRTNLNTTYQKLRDSHDNLNELVKDRTQKLELSNQELNSFCYSVSHDLRGPLRGINGFTQVLMEDYNQQLSEKGQDYLRRIHSAGLRMSDIIDDLLRLSRLNQSELHFTRVNLSKLAESILSSLQDQHPQRNVTIEITPNITACCDATLIRTALENLLGNAWKYTAREPSPWIRFRTLDCNGETTFCIEDNGAGFNMAYAEKLFLPFQRLHREEDFEGNGIGLATVQRVIHRHGGQVWGESPCLNDKGACFHFTLPEHATG